MLTSQTVGMRSCATCQCRSRYCPPPNGDPADVFDDVAARQPAPRLTGRLHSLVTSRVTHSLLLLAAAVGNGLMVGALDAMHELVAPLADLGESLAVHAVVSR